MFIKKYSFEVKEILGREIISHITIFIQTFWITIITLQKYLINLTLCFSHRLCQNLTLIFCFQMQANLVALVTYSAAIPSVFLLDCNCFLDNIELRPLRGRLASAMMWLNDSEVLYENCYIITWKDSRVLYY